MARYRHAYVFPVLCALLCAYVAGCPVPNLAPEADDQAVTVAFNTLKGITLTASDPDNGPQALTYSIVSPPQHGTLTGTSPSVTYTPNTGYSGPDSFTFKANDGGADSNTATVSITVLAAGQTPGSGSTGTARFTKYRGPFTFSWTEVRPDIETTFSWQAAGTLEFGPSLEFGGPFVLDTHTAFYLVPGASSVQIGNFRRVDPDATCTGDAQATAAFASGVLAIYNSPGEYELWLNFGAYGFPTTCIDRFGRASASSDAAVAHVGDTLPPCFMQRVASPPDVSRLTGDATWSCTTSSGNFTATLTWDLTGVE